MKMVIKYKCPCGIFIADEDAPHKAECLPFIINGWGVAFEPFRRELQTEVLVRYE